MLGSEEADNSKNVDGLSNGDASHTSAVAPEYDEFGLKIKRHVVPMPVSTEEEGTSKEESPEQETRERNGAEHDNASADKGLDTLKVPVQLDDAVSSDGEDEFKDAQSTPGIITPLPQETKEDMPQSTTEKTAPSDSPKIEHEAAANPPKEAPPPTDQVTEPSPKPAVAPSASRDDSPSEARTQNSHQRRSLGGGGISEWSHQKIAEPKEEVKDVEEDEWQTMPAFAPYDIYDDDNRLIAREAHDSDVEADAYEGLGGAGKGYTRVQLDDDAQSATSLDENTQYLFKEANGTGAGEMEDEEQRDALSQMQATKDLLTEGQRIAYVGVTRLVLTSMYQQAEAIITAKGSKKGEVSVAAEALQMWSQKMMARLYAHMEISAAEQIMIEQLADHGVIPTDMTPTLMQNARVKNPMAEKAGSTTGAFSPRPDSVSSFGHGKRLSVSSTTPNSPRLPLSPRYDDPTAQIPPPYQEKSGEDMPEVQIPSQLPTTAKLDIDLRWTVLCDLFLTLIADSVYDARSRTLLEKVGENLDITWLDICRFEKRVTDALEMQQAAEKENWNEDEHKENRRKLALTKRYVMMGLATVGGGLVIGLSAGLLAPVIGAGLAAGFTTIGVAGTSGFLAGAGGAAIITSGAAASGGIIAVRAAGRRTGAVKTFEYRPLHNNKRVNLIVTVSGWMTGKVDDVRLPYSTVDPIMGDVYSVLWEPEMLRSMGDTINILATEALTQGLQQVLGSTILIGLMAALQLPVVLTKLAYLIDNPWTVSLDRANAAGLILADSLIDRNLGTRPITFVGYSLGSRVIFSCLKELSKKGAYGLVQNVYLFGSPIVAKKDEYLKARSVVAGRFVNGYARNDWILGYLFRLTSGGISRVAGLAPIEGVPGVENVDVTELVPGHMSYRTAMPRLLREVGWLVESDEFTEIEDPDPENHQQRQRELINEIEEARKDFEKKEKEAKSGKFGFFSRKKKTVVEKKEWETYEEAKGEPAGSSAYTEDTQGNNHGVLFDIDAIRAELASEQIEVKELKSTLPPMKLDLAGPSSAEARNPRSPLRETKSYDASSMLKPMGSFNSPAHSPRQSSSEYIPQVRSPPVYAEQDEEEVQMSFDTAYRSPPRSAVASFMNLRETIHEEPEVERRPELKSVRTEPQPGKELPQLPTTAVGLGLGYEHNAWADEEEEFGHEKEIEMTFA